MDEETEGNVKKKEVIKNEKKKAAKFESDEDESIAIADYSMEIAQTDAG